MPARPEDCRRPEHMTEHQRLAEVADLLAAAIERARRARILAGDAREEPGTLGERQAGLEPAGTSGPDGTAG